MKARISPAETKVEVVFARNRAYIRWPYDHKFMAVFKQYIPFSVSHFYRESKWWHVEIQCWEKAYELFRSRYPDENIHISGDFSSDEAPAYDEDYPEHESESDEWDLNGIAAPNDSLEKLTMQSAFAILHLLPSASLDDAKAMYRFLSNQNHPDKGGDDEEQVRLNRAYAYISDGGSWE